VKKSLIGLASIALIALAPIAAHAGTSYSAVSMTFTSSPDPTDTTTQIKASTGVAANLATSTIGQSNWQLSVRFHDVVRNTYGQAISHQFGSSSKIPGSTSAGVTSSGTAVSLELSLVKVIPGNPASLPVTIAGLWRSN
jgi:hypothetical protein